MGLDAPHDMEIQKPLTNKGPLAVQFLRMNNYPVIKGLCYKPGSCIFFSQLKWQVFVNPFDMGPIYKAIIDFREFLATKQNHGMGELVFFRKASHLMIIRIICLGKAPGNMSFFGVECDSSNSLEQFPASFPR